MERVKSKTSVPFDWLRHLNKTLLELDEIPLLGTPPPFPWEKLGNKASEMFGLTNFSVTSSEWQWRTEKDILTGLGEPLHSIRLSLAPLDGPLWWVMPEDAIPKLMGWLLANDKAPLQLDDTDFREAFLHFTLLETLHLVQQLVSDNTLSPTLAGNDMPTGSALSLDINASLEEETLWGRLLFSPQLRESWKHHNLQRERTTLPPIAQDLEVTVHLEAGKVAMGLNQWRAINVGDFVILDSCSVDPAEEKCRVTLTVNGKPIFRGKIKKGKLKILEYPLIHEVADTMATEDEPHEEEDTPKDADALEEFEDEVEDFDVDEMFDETEEAVEEPPEAEEEAEGAEEAEEEAEAMPEAEIAEAEEAPTESKAVEKEEGAEAAPVEGAAAGPAETIKLDEIPIVVTVEVARIKTTVQTLTNLQPGNLLELHVQPEHSVDLTVNGRRIGRGELMRVGEALGVRVLEVGK